VSNACPGTPALPVRSASSFIPSSFIPRSTVRHHEPRDSPLPIDPTAPAWLDVDLNFPLTPWFAESEQRPSSHKPWVHPAV
jgi:hypothetical protein